MKQQRLFKDTNKSFGGDLMKRRRGRGARPIDTKNSMHLVLRSTQATGAKSFTRHRGLIKKLLYEFAERCGIQIHNFANVGNHLHIHLRLANRFTWNKFIRGLTAAIAIKIGRKSRWAKKTKRFWDRRPFTRVVIGRQAFKRMQTYVDLNFNEGYGWDRDELRVYMSG